MTTIRCFLNSISSPGLENYQRCNHSAESDRKIWSAFFKEGASYSGNTGHFLAYYSVQLANTYQGVPVEAYVDQLIGATITGQTSGVTAVVDNVLFSADSERDNLTLYVAYKGSSTRDNATQTFSDGETTSFQPDNFIWTS